MNRRMIRAGVRESGGRKAPAERLLHRFAEAHGIRDALGAGGLADGAGQRLEAGGVARPEPLEGARDGGPSV